MTATPTFDITTYSDQETRDWGERLGQVLQPGDIVALQGDLGAGKTTLTQGIGLGLGVADRITSPTFTLINEYTGRDGVRLIHTDSYRLGDLTVPTGETKGDIESEPASGQKSAVLEAATFGMAEILDSVQDDQEAVIVIEWAERLVDLLPPDYLVVILAHVPDDDQARTLRLIPHGPRALSLIKQLV